MIPKPCYSEFLHPYVSTSHDEFRDFSEYRLNFAKDGVEHEAEAVEKVYKVKPRVFFKVPFGGDSSIYREDFKHPAMKSAFLNEVCLFPDFFESMKNGASSIPGIYSTEQKQVGSGKPVRAIV